MVINWNFQTCSWIQHLEYYTHSTTPEVQVGALPSWRSTLESEWTCHYRNPPYTKSKHIIKIFAIHPFPFLSQKPRWCFREIMACAMGHVVNCDTICKCPPWRQCWLAFYILHMDWQLLQLHNNLPWVQCSPICFMFFRQHIVFPYPEVGWASGLSGTQKYVRGIRSITFAENLWRRKRFFLL